MSDLCPRCKGRGTIKVSNGMDYDRHDCPECKGQGTLTVTNAMVRAQLGLTSPTYDMDTLEPSKKEPEMIVRCLFSQGDVVYLKSGGPAMTISSQASESGMVRTRWFVFRQGAWGEPESGEFAQDSLTKDPPGENVSELRQAATDAFLALVPLCLRGKEAGRPATIRLANILGIDWQRMSIPSDDDDTSCCR